QLITVRRIVDAISRTGIDPQLTHAFPDRADVARIAVCKALDAHVDARSTREITQAAKPLVKHIGSQKLRHNCNVIYILHRVKWLESATACRSALNVISVTYRAGNQGVLSTTSTSFFPRVADSRSISVQAVAAFSETRTPHNA